MLYTSSYIICMLACWVLLTADAVMLHAPRGTHRGMGTESAKRGQMGAVGRLLFPLLAAAASFRPGRAVHARQHQRQPPEYDPRPVQPRARRDDEAILATVADMSQTYPYFSQHITVIEAENFTALDPGGWEAREWAHSPGYFAANSANCFISRRAYLHAAKDAPAGSRAASRARIAAAGTYTVLLRYEALYRFETPVLVTISQHNQTLLSRVYGYRANLKVWGYPYGDHPGSCPGLQAECVWPWGSTDNTVYEGVGVTVPLEAGEALVTSSPWCTTPQVGRCRTRASPTATSTCSC
jgi:hypothetical protein